MITTPELEEVKKLGQLIENKKVDELNKDAITDVFDALLKMGHTLDMDYNTCIFRVNGIVYNLNQIKLSNLVFPEWVKNTIAYLISKDEIIPVKIILPNESNSIITAQSTKSAMRYVLSENDEDVFWTLEDAKKKWQEHFGNIYNRFIPPSCGIKIKVYPVEACKYAPYTIELDIFVDCEKRKTLVEEWVEHNLLNVDRWEFI